MEGDPFFGVIRNFSNILLIAVRQNNRRWAYIEGILRHQQEDKQKSNRVHFKNVDDDTLLFNISTKRMLSSNLKLANEEAAHRGLVVPDDTS